MLRTRLVRVLCSVAALASLVLCSCAWPTGDGGSEPPDWFQAAEDVREILEPQLDLWASRASEGDAETIAAVRLGVEGLFTLATAGPSLDRLDALVPRIDELLIARGDDAEERAEKLAMIRSGLALVRVALRNVQPAAPG